MEIRRLVADDAETFRDFRAYALRTTPEAFGEAVEEHLAHPVEDTEARFRLGEDNFVLGAFDGPRLCGTVGFYRDPRVKRRQKGWIWGMFVDESVRGSGVGRKLLEEAVRRARDTGIVQVQLSVVATQEAARGLYLSMGFEPWGVERRALLLADGTMLDEEHMMLRL